MSNKKDHSPDSPSHESTLLPFKKRGISETMASDSNHGDVKKLKLDELQKKAYFHVLHAFATESVEISSPRITIIKELKKEWNIDYKTHIGFEYMIKADIMAQTLRKKSLASDKKEKQNGKIAYDGEKEKAQSFWGSVNPEALVGLWVLVRMPDEENFDEFVISEYDAENEMHRFEAVDPDAMERDEMLSRMDIREIPPEDIMWPNF
ncbi:unnamed protein product [Thlaspi arvense]|uniref:ENT domain-containing protein n=1 Tax=Thlaspi arvense TaxID=13288 RepID=A0AAU9S9R6_THLAR|nr:unnamed protein product [Thlaspi arvense]